MRSAGVLTSKAREHRAFGVSLAAAMFVLFASALAAAQSSPTALSQLHLRPRRRRPAVRLLKSPRPCRRPPPPVHRTWCRRRRRKISMPLLPAMRGFQSTPCSSRCLRLRPIHPPMRTAARSRVTRKSKAGCHRSSSKPCSSRERGRADDAVRNGIAGGEALAEIRRGRRRLADCRRRERQPGRDRRLAPLQSHGARRDCGGRDGRRVFSPAGCR